MISSMQLVRTAFALLAATWLFGCHKDAPQGQSMTTPGPFEGMVIVKYEDPAKPVTTLTYEIKGSKFRVNLPEETNQGKKGCVLFDATSKKTLLVLDDRKVFVTIDLASANVAGAIMPKLDTNAKLDQGGKIETVAGYDCEEWTITTDTGKSELCVVKGVPWFSFGSGPSGAGEPAWIGEITAGKYFPLRVITRDKDGAQKRKMEATKIERTSVADSRLEAPPDYHEVDMKELLMPAAMSAVPLHP